MKSKEKHEGEHPSITEAVSKLSSIAEMDFDREIAMATMEEDVVTPMGEETPPLSVNWLYEQDPKAAVEMLREIFHVVLSYLRKYYKKEFEQLPSQHVIEGIKAIMVLVGEAAKKLDQHREIFEGSKIHSITELPEYKRLQDFYLSRIAHKIDEGVLSKWILALSRRLIEQQEAIALARPALIQKTKHLFVDLESVKKDTEYELFFIRKEDGSRFFSPRLIRNIKLVCDFGDRLSELKQDDPLESITVWRDHMLQSIAKDILNFLAPPLHRFYQESAKVRKGELAGLLSKALFALMLCSNSHNVMHDSSVKNSHDYFIDFQEFLRAALQSREYQKLIAYPPAKNDRVGNCLLDLTYSLCEGLFLHASGPQSIITNLNGMIEEAVTNSASTKHGARDIHSMSFTDQVNANYNALTALLKKHANGPLMKVLDILEEGNYHAYDPILQDNIPHIQFNIEAMTKHIPAIRLPCPSHQEFIQKVNIIQEFKALLHGLSKSTPAHRFLVINLQDRTSWKEHYRSSALEELQKHKDFAKQLVVVTLPKDTEFYYQVAPYQRDNHAEAFIENFRKEMQNEDSGFFFPEWIKEALFPDFIDSLLHTIHRVFFGSRNTLMPEHRMNFIEIFYLFLELKLIELVRPDGFSLVCKDGIDLGPAATAPLFIFRQWMHKDKLTKEDIDHLNLILHAPAVLVRERTMNAARFKRTLSMLKEMEAIHNTLGEKFAETMHEAFGPLYKTDILGTKA